MPKSYNYRTSKRTGIRWYYSKPFLIILIIIFILVLRGSWGVYRKASQGKELRQIAEEEQRVLEQERVSLENQLDRLKTQTGQETEIRKKFNVSKFNEKLVVIVDRDEVATTTVEEVSKIKGFFSSLMFWK